MKILPRQRVVRRSILVAAIVLSFLLCGCDGASVDEEGISGRWRAAYRGNEIELDLHHARSTISGSGTWRTDGGAEVGLEVSGVYRHPDVAIEIESTTAPYVVEGVFVGIFEEHTMTGHFGTSQYITFFRH